MNHAIPHPLRRPLRPLILLLLACIFTLSCAGAEDEVTRVLFAEGETLAGYDVWQDGRAVALEALPGDTRLIFYLLRTCGDCAVDFPGYTLLAGLLEDSTITPAFLWQTALPEPEQITLPAAQSYTVHADLRLGDWVPTYFYTNAAGVIEKKTIELSEMVAFLGEALPAETRAQQLAAYLARTGRALLLTAYEPSTALLDAARAQTPEGCDILIVSGERGQEWADIEDPHGILRLFGETEAEAALLYQQDGTLMAIPM